MIPVKDAYYRCIIHSISKLDLLKILYLMIVGIYKKYYLNFQSTQDNFF